MNHSLQLTPNITQPHTLGMYVIAPAQLYLEPNPPSNSFTCQSGPRTSSNDGFCLGILSALGLPCALHLAVDGIVLSKDAIEDPKPTQDNLTTQSITTKPSWMASVTALELNKIKKKANSNEAPSTSKPSMGIRFH